MVLDRLTKESIKTGLAMTIAYFIALSMDWEEPKWAGFCVAVLSTQAMGENLNKGLNRILGSATGVIMSAILVALFAQHRWAFMFFLALWYAWCCYCNMGQRHQHFWFVSAMVSLVISVDGALIPDEAFYYIVLRMEETVLGMVVYSLVMVFVWPVNSRDDLVAKAASVLDIQQRHLAQAREMLAGTGDPQVVVGLRQQELAAIPELQKTVNAATSDTDEVREVASHWRAYAQSVLGLGESIQRWRECIRDLPRASLDIMLPGLQASLDEIDSRLVAVGKLLQGQETQFQCGDLVLDISRQEGNELSGFQRAALHAFCRHLRDIDRYTRSQLDLLGDIRGSRVPLPAPPEGGRAAPLQFTPDFDRIFASVKCFCMIVIGFLFVLYVPDLPAGFSTLIVACAVGLNLLAMPQVPIHVVFLPTIIGIAISGAVYMWIMPLISGFLGLGLILFLVTFFFCQVFHKPQQGVARVLGLIIFTALIDVSNDQVYDFMQVALIGLAFMLVYAFHAVFAWIPYSPLPEVALRRRFERYFTSAASLIKRSVPEKAREQDSLSLRYHRNEIATLPAKMQGWLPHVAMDFGPDTAKGLAPMFGRLSALSYRLRVLEEARVLRLPDDIPGALKEDLAAVRAAVIGVLESLAVEPGGADALPKSQVVERLPPLERSVMAYFREVDPDMDAELQANLYTRLSAYRGVTEALGEYAGVARAVDWDPWYQPRFA